MPQNLLLYDNLEERLNQMSETGNHQGVIASMAAYEYASICRLIMNLSVCQSIDCGSIHLPIDPFIISKEKQDTNLLSPLNLAYIGDAIYEVVIRTIVLEEGNAPPFQIKIPKQCLKTCCCMIIL